MSKKRILNTTQEMSVSEGEESSYSSGSFNISSPNFSSINSFDETPSPLKSSSPFEVNDILTTSLFSAEDAFRHLMAQNTPNSAGSVFQSYKLSLVENTKKIPNVIYVRSLNPMAIKQLQNAVNMQLNVDIVAESTDAPNVYAIPFTQNMIESVERLYPLNTKEHTKHITRTIGNDFVSKNTLNGKSLTIDIGVYDPDSFPRNYLDNMSLRLSSEDKDMMTSLTISLPHKFNGHTVNKGNNIVNGKMVYWVELMPDMVKCVIPEESLRNGFLDSMLVSLRRDRANIAHYNNISDYLQSWGAAQLPTPYLSESKQLPSAEELKIGTSTPIDIPQKTAPFTPRMSQEFSPSPSKRSSRRFSRNPTSMSKDTIRALRSLLDAYGTDKEIEDLAEFPEFRDQHPNFIEIHSNFEKQVIGRWQLSSSLFANASNSVDTAIEITELTAETLLGLLPIDLGFITKTGAMIAKEFNEAYKEALTENVAVLVPSMEDATKFCKYVILQLGKEVAKTFEAIPEMYKASAAEDITKILFATILYATVSKEIQLQDTLDMSGKASVLVDLVKEDCIKIIEQTQKKALKEGEKPNRHSWVSKTRTSLSQLPVPLKERKVIAADTETTPSKDYRHEPKISFSQPEWLAFKGCGKQDNPIIFTFNSQQARNSFCEGNKDILLHCRNLDFKVDEEKGGGIFSRGEYSVEIALSKSGKGADYFEKLCKQAKAINTKWESQKPDKPIQI